MQTIYLTATSDCIFSTTFVALESIYCTPNVFVPEILKNRGEQTGRIICNKEKTHDVG